MNKVTEDKQMCIYLVDKFAYNNILDVECRGGEVVPTKRSILERKRYQNTI